MVIKGLTAFTYFINQHGLSNLTPEIQQLCRCVDEYKRLCECDSVDVRNKKFNTCMTLYINSVQRISQFKREIFSKISDNVITFNNDSNQRLSTITR